MMDGHIMRLLRDGRDPVSRAFHRLLPYRTWVQAGFAAVWLAPLHWFSVCAPVFHCNACPLASFACPIGVLARASALHMVPLGALAVLIVVGASVGTMTCGWACPFGWLQDLASKIQTRPLALPRGAGYARYGVLAVTVLAVPYLFGGDHPLFICRVCPAAGLEVSVPRLVKSALAGGPAIWPDAPKFIVLGIFLAAIFVFHRPWCRILCPLGAIFSLFNRFSLVAVSVDDERCTQCRRCHRSCAAGLQPEREPDSGRCLRCLECLACPREAVKIEPRLKS